VRTLRCVYERENEVALLTNYCISLALYGGGGKRPLRWATAAPAGVCVCVVVVCLCVCEISEWRAFAGVCVCVF